MDITTNLMTLFLIILLGYLSRRYRLLPDRSADVFVALILHITLPALILVSMDLPYDPELSVSVWETALLALAFTLFAIVLSRVLVRRLPLAKEQRRQWAFGLTFGNVTFIGYPVAFLVLGAKGVFLGAVFDFVQTVFMFTYGIALLGGVSVRRAAVRRLLRDPVILALLGGLALYFSGLELPRFLQQALQGLGDSTSALSMLAVGLLLRFRGFSERSLRWTQFGLVAMKLLVLPFGFIALLPLLPVSYDTGLVSLVMIATPTGILSTVLSEKHAGDGRYAAGSVFLSHLLCLATIPLVLFLAPVS